MLCVDCRRVACLERMSSWQVGGPVYMLEASSDPFHPSYRSRRSFSRHSKASSRTTALPRSPGLGDIAFLEAGVTRDTVASRGSTIEPVACPARLNEWRARTAPSYLRCEKASCKLQRHSRSLIGARQASILLEGHLLLGDDVPEIPLTSLKSTLCPYLLYSPRARQMSRARPQTRLPRMMEHVPRQRRVTDIASRLAMRRAGNALQF